ncbi:hypothetical protein ATK86_0916 [Nocardia fluminea]|uniref:Uncharacterized protein n=1 Tax=Nocardia fluminea TaxID=134984 RepID=A0A2N3WYE1_9NOCA|nr:hypothetical protein ATK86_0916 [Nocardia fluminea]
MSLRRGMGVRPGTASLSEVVVTRKRTVPDTEADSTASRRCRLRHRPSPSIRPYETCRARARNAGNEIDRVQRVVATPQVMEGVMGRPSNWMREVTGRVPMRPPGHSGHQRVVERAFWTRSSRVICRRNVLLRSVSRLRWGRGGSVMLAGSARRHEGVSGGATLECQLAKVSRSQVKWPFETSSCCPAEGQHNATFTAVGVGWGRPVWQDRRPQPRLRVRRGAGRFRRLPAVRRRPCPVRRGRPCNGRFLPAPAPAHVGC